MEPNPILGLDGQLMVTAAHRYCLGRNSYIVGSCIDWLKRWWDSFEENTQNVIVRDTVEALRDNNAGSKYDYSDWKVFAEWAWLRLSCRNQDWVLDAVEHRGKDWPLAKPVNKEV